MANKVSRKAPTGNMDTDSDPRYVGKGEREGDYSYAKNIQRVSQDGNVQGSAESALGNEFAFDLGSVSQQNKRYRITFDGDVTKQHELRFLSTQRDANMVVGTGPNGELQFNGTVGSFVSAFNTAISGSGVSWVQSVGATTVEIELASYPMYQWYLESVGPDVISVVCIAEAIPVDLAGPLKDIGSYDLLGDLFIFSTTQDNEPTEISANIILVGPTSGGNYIGPVTELLFDAPHGLVQGQWIRITGSNEAFLNGTFVVHTVTSTTQVGIVTSTAWGLSFPVTTLGTPTVSSNPSGIGEIGVAQRNDDTDTWTYTRLLRSVELNFVSRWKVDCDAEKDNDEVSLYFDDDYNPYRRFYYIGPYVNNGAFIFSGTANAYQIGSISAQLYGFMPRPYVLIDYIEQPLPGGSLLTGNYKYFAVLKDQSGNESKPSDLSGTVVVYSDNENSLAIGNQEGETSSKSTKIRIRNIDQSVFSQIAIGYVSKIGGVVSAYLMPFQSISGSEIEYVHSGLEESITYDVANLSSLWNASNYEFAKNLRIIDQRVVRSNLRKPRYRDLEDFFKSFKHAVCVERIDPTQAPSQSNPAGEFKDVSNVFNKTGYMFNETYRFAGRAVFLDGSISEWFWIDDIKVDPLPSNSANPSDNRRSQTSPNSATSFDLTENISGVPFSQTGRRNPAGQVFDSVGNLIQNPQGNDGDYFSESRYFHKKVLVPYIEFFDFNMSFSVNGVPLSSMVKYIEIGRCDVVEEVISCGIAVSSVKITTAFDLSVSGEDAPSASSIWRGPSIIGSFQVINQGSDDVPDVKLGIGVRTSDRDGIIETYHEYPYAHSSFPISRMSGGSGVPPSDVSNVQTHISEHYPVPTQGEGEWVNTFNGFNVLGSTPVYYPSMNGVDFCFNNIPTTADLFATSGSSQTVNNFGNYLKSERRFLSIYSPDLIFGSRDVALSDVSSIIDFGEALLDMTQFSNTFYWKGSQSANEFVQMPSCVSRYIPENMGTTFNEYAPDNLITIDSGERLNATGFTGFRKAHDAYTFSAKQFFNNNGIRVRDIGYEGLWKMLKGPVAYVENGGNGITSQSKNPDHGVRYVQLFKQKDNKYGAISDSEYKTTNTVFDVSSFQSIGSVPSGLIKVFGGDTYTQQSFLKTKITDLSVRPGANAGEWDDIDTNIAAIKGPGFAGGFFVYTQNRLNAQLRYDTPEQFIPLKDTVKFGEWAWDFNNLDQHTYSEAYNADPSIGVLQSSGNEGLDPIKYDFPSRIHWSQKKIYGELSDSYSLFLDLDIKDLDLRFGEIMHHENVNGELFTLQPRKWQAQLFNTRGELQVSGNAIGAVIGDGSVLARDGQTLSRYGTQNKWSAVLGTSPGGKDVLYWFNAENGLFLRFGADGTVVLSDIRRMRAFSSKAAKWVRGKDAPAFDQGIRAVWDDRSKEAIWTFTGWRDVPEWTPPSLILVTVLAGTVLSNPNAPSVTYENLPRFFRATVTHTKTSAREPGVGADWQDFYVEIPVTDTDYYSVFTLAHNELTNGFTTFYSHIPKTYLKWRDTFLSSHPTIRNLLFEHRKGLPTTWYGRTAAGINPKVEDAEIEMIVNDLPEQSIRGVAVGYLTDSAPDRVDYSTKSQRTYSEAADFEQRDDQFYAPIRGDVSQGAAPNEAETLLSGDYMKVRFTIFGGTYNLLHSIVVKFRDRVRRINT